MAHHDEHSRSQHLLDETAAVPTVLEHERFAAVPLTSATAALDHASYVASPDVIRMHSDGRWPTDGFTLEDNLPLVAMHEADHQKRRAFTFVLLAPSRAEALGCVYLNSLAAYLRRAGAAEEVLAAVPSPSAMVTFWIRQDRHETRLTADVAAAVHEWLLDEWPLATHLFRILPGELTSRTALDRLGLQRVSLELPAERRPYLWYGPSSASGVF